MKQHQNTILWQINEKNEKRRKELMEDMEQERVKRLQELTYQMRIKEEQDKGRIMVSSVDSSWRKLRELDFTKKSMQSRKCSVLSIDG